jgi:hypothetical protein
VTPAEVAAWLKVRAASYSRDAYILRGDGSTDDALVFEAIRDELRRCAEQFEACMAETERLASLPTAQLKATLSNALGIRIE